MAHPIDVSTKTILKVALVALAIWLAYLISDILIMIFFAVIISSAVDRWAGKLRDRLGVWRTFSVIAIYLIFVLVVAGIFYIVVPVFVNEIGNLTDNLPQYYEKVAKYFDPSATASQSLMLGKLQEFLNEIENNLLKAGGGVFTLFRSIFSGMAMFVATFVLSFYLALQEDGVKRFLQFVTPKSYESYVLDLWQRTQRKLGKWLQGQLMLGFIIGAMVFIGLTILGVPYALVLAVFAAILELVPMAGPIIAAVPAIILGALVSPLTGLLTLIFYMIIQPTENHLIVPQVMQRAVGLNPVVIIIALLVGAKLGGILGILIAVPVAAIFVEILGDLGEQNKDVII